MTSDGRDTMLDLEFVDKIAMQFEADWVASYRYKDLIAFASRHFGDPDACCAIIPELIMIDLDRRWKEFSDWVESAENADQALAKIDEIPTPADYITESKNFAFQMHDEHCAEIIKHDFLIRAGYDIRSYPGAQIPAELIEKVRGSNPEITVFIAGEQKFRQSTWGRFEIGRRDTGEPAPFDWSCLEASTKLVCADLMDTSVSRNQAIVQYVGRKRAVLKNTSRNRCFETNKRCLLSPGQAAIIDLPTTIILNNILITLFPIAQ